jgi:hypothetical protein
MDSMPEVGTDLSRQCAGAVFMVRPAAFGWNAETAPTNRLQACVPGAGDSHGPAVQEFERVVTELTRAGVEVHAFDDRPAPRRPDAVFPNNWVSMHSDGTVVLYPMLAPNRRLERRPELLAALVARGGFRIGRLLDLTHHEREGRFLEGTGSVVFDHVGRRAFASLSPRSDVAVLHELCAELDYEPVVFRAAGPDGTPVYHTNVLLSIGRRFALVCAEAIAAEERGEVMERLSDEGRRVVTISLAQMCGFAGNLLELGGQSSASVLAVSQRGWDSLGADARSQLAGQVGRVATIPVPTIEDAAGGSVRCMLAEVFLPRA